MRWVWSLIFCLVAAASHAAQTFTIPQGTTTYGPYSVTVASHYSEILLSKTLWTDPNIILAARIESSPDKGKTWQFVCGFKTHGGGGPVTGAVCPFDPATTHIRLIATVTGGDIVLPGSPVVNTKSTK